ncbi:c-type cytochrome [Phenylobacterium sp.]|uniref:c-type cytochrome n=1 Tax=Phenylobacterium sp. TaxID=1871053 RepID=UPI002E2F93CE|nr:c-type cytochrome [Phenylobacterium sp.]HEX4712674.1 c-type cytochrome [Phenylobacterium sp.]
MPAKPDAQRAAAPLAPPAAEPALVAYGRYLAVVGDCEGCHNRPGGQANAGGLPLNTPFGVLYSTNITPDRETGLGTWTADDFWNAMHKGVRKDGAKLYPAFPYPYFTHATRAESDALYAYYRTVAPVSYRPPANKLPFPLNIRFLVTFWNMLNFKEDPAPATGPTPAAHIVRGLGHCGGCHSPKNFLGGDKAGHEMEGGTLDNWLAPALNADVRRGLGAWSAAEVAEYLKNGRNARANSSASMADVVRYSTSRMTDADLLAIGAWLKALPSHAAARPTPHPDPRVMAAGQAIYVDECSACHAMDGKAAPTYFPPLPGAAVTQSVDPTTVIRFILAGTQTVATDARPTPLSMPAYAWKLNDAEIAAVATYIRNSWGNSAPVVTASDVAKLRRKVAAKPIRKPSARI